MKKLNQREEAILGMVLSYAQANWDDINDSFQAYNEGDDVFYDEMIEYNGQIHDSIGPQEIERLAMKIGIELY